MLRASANELLDQLSSVITSCKTEDFKRPLPVLSNSTLGQHVRHTLEFFLCLFDARISGTINYDDRKHDEVIETDRKLAIGIIESIRQFMEEQQDDFDVVFEANYSLEEGTKERMSSSFYRELAYNIEHAIHHMALIKVAVNESINYIELPKNFGVASSTIRYQARPDA